MAVAALLQFDESEMQNVLSASATAGAGLLEVITGKSEQKPYNIANAAVAGVNAALYGKLFAGPNDVLGGARGFARNLSSDFDIEQLLAPVKKFAIEGTYTKPYAACRHCHAPGGGCVDAKQTGCHPTRRHQRDLCEDIRSCCLWS